MVQLLLVGALRPQRWQSNDMQAVWDVWRHSMLDRDRAEPQGSSKQGLRRESVVLNPAWGGGNSQRVLKTPNAGG